MNLQMKKINGFKKSDKKVISPIDHEDQDVGKLREKMKIASENLEFEEAIMLRNKIRELEKRKI